MSILNQIQRIEEAKQTILAKALEMGIDNVTQDTNITDLANNMSSINVNATSNILIDKDTNLDSNTILENNGPVYYKNGLSITMDSDFAETQKKGQKLTPDNVTATSNRVSEGYKFVAADGSVVTGSVTTEKELHLSIDRTNVLKLNEYDHAGEIMFTDGMYVRVDHDCPNIKFNDYVNGYTHSSRGGSKIPLDFIIEAIPDSYKNHATIGEKVVNKTTATPSTVVQGNSFVDKEGNVVQGTIPVYEPAATGEVELIEGTSETFNAGYYPTAFTVRAVSDIESDENSFITKTAGTATANDIASGQIAWVNGTKVTGNLPVYENSGTNVFETYGLTAELATNDGYAIVIAKSSDEGAILRKEAQIKVDTSALEARLAAI